jgi:hypothetical protein
MRSIAGGGKFRRQGDVASCERCRLGKFQHKSGFEPQSFNNIGAPEDHWRRTKKVSPWTSMTHIPGNMLERDWGENALDQ